MNRVEQEIKFLNAKFDNLTETLQMFLNDLNNRNLLLQNTCMGIISQIETVNNKLKDLELSLYNQGITIDDNRNDFHTVMNEINDVKNKIDNLKVYSVISKDNNW